MHIGLSCLLQDVKLDLERVKFYFWLWRFNLSLNLPKHGGLFSNPLFWTTVASFVSKLSLPLNHSPFNLLTWGFDFLCRLEVALIQISLPWLTDFFFEIAPRNVFTELVNIIWASRGVKSLGTRSDFQQSKFPYVVSFIRPQKPFKHIKTLSICICMEFWARAVLTYLKVRIGDIFLQSSGIKAFCLLLAPTEVKSDALAFAIVSAAF